MKVVMISSYALNEDKIPGGIEMHTAGLAAHLANREGMELHLITFGNENKRITKDNMTLQVIDTTFYPLSIPLGAVRLQKLIRDLHPDIVHVQGTHFPYSLIAAFLQRKHRTILTVHGILAKEVQFRTRTSVMPSFLFVGLERYAVRTVREIIAVSPHVKDVLSSMTRSSIHVIPNGIEYDAIQAIEPQESIEHAHILFVGELGRVKGVDVLIRAIPLIKGAIPTIRAYLCGAGPQEGEFKQLVKALNIEENVKFLGFVSGEEKYRYYKAADICVFPSRYETFGIVCLEAMACGKPVIASNVGGLPFLVEDGKTGLLVTPEAVNDLAEKILILLQDKALREKMGAAGRERAKEFSWDRVAGQTLQVYTSRVE